jgi:hypothetical protein
LKEKENELVRKEQNLNEMLAQAEADRVRLNEET